MIEVSSFRSLRLSDFFPAEDIVELEDWQYLGETWVGQAIGFSEWLCKESSPNMLGSLTLDLNNLPDSEAAAVSRRLELPLRFGMTREDIESQMGPPSSEQSFVPDRGTYNFTSDEYLIGCTVHDGNGLIHVFVRLP